MSVLEARRANCEMSVMLNSPTPIRCANEDDAAEITRLCAELGYPASLTEMRQRLSSLLEAGDHRIAVACGQRSGLLGWVAAEYRLVLESGERVEIVGLVVDPSARRQRIGKALVAEIERWAVARDVGTIMVRSSIARSESHRFYQELGYERTKTQHVYAKGV